MSEPCECKIDFKTTEHFGGSFDIECGAIVYCSLHQSAGEMLEALISANGWVRTQAMQTYSRVAAKQADENDLLIKRAEGNLPSTK